MNISRHPRAILGLAALLSAGAFAVSTRADEIRLKDGKKLYGVIVAYEDNMFKIKTDFGYVLVEKDKIASIIPDTPPDAAGTRAAVKPAAKSRREKTGEGGDDSSRRCVSPRNSRDRCQGRRYAADDQTGERNAEDKSGDSGNASAATQGRTAADTRRGSRESIHQSRIFFPDV
jgi:hypothetical protein